MTQETLSTIVTLAMLTTDLLVMREQIEHEEQDIKQILRGLATKRQCLQQMVDCYNEKRVELLKQEMQARDLTWCTCCSAVILKREAKLLLIESREQYSCGYEGAYYSFRDSVKLHRACLTCYNDAINRHGWTGIYDTQMKDQAKFFAFRVKKSKNGYYAQKFGVWEKLDDNDFLFDESLRELVSKLTREWHLPVALKWSSITDTLTICE